MSKVIKNFCKKHCIRNYTIRKDGSVDVANSVDLTFLDLEELPFKFNNILGAFDVSGNRLKNFNNCPKVVGGFFGIDSNQLTSLKGCPEHIGKVFYCTDNNISDLDHLPKTFEKIYIISDKLKSISIPMDYDKLVCINKDRLIRKYKLNEIFKNII